MNKSVLLFDVANPGYLPLVQELLEQGFRLFMNATPLTQEVQAAGLPFQAWEAFIPRNIQEHVRQKLPQLGDKLAQSLEKAEVRQAFSSPLGDFLPRTGGMFFRQLLGLLANEMTALETLEALTRQHALHLIVFGCDNNHIERALVGYARQLGIRTLQLAHGIYERPLARKAGEMETLYSDYIAVFGQRGRDVMVELGNSPERIFLTGAPLWDALYTSEAKVDRREACRRLGLDADRPIVLYCASYADGSWAFFPYLARRLLAVHQAIVRAVQQVGDHVQLIVRPHPHEFQRANLSTHEEERLAHAYKNWLTQQGVPGVHLLRKHKVEAIRAADVVIAIGSSSVIPEAMILQRPVVTIPRLKEENLLYTAQDGVVVVDEDAQLPDVLATLLADPARRRAIVDRHNAVLPELNYGHDGRATERVAALVGTLASQSSDSFTSNQSFSRPSQARKAPPLNVLFAVHDFPPYSRAGTELYTHDLAQALQRRGHSVRVLYPRYMAKPPDQISVQEGHHHNLPVTQIFIDKNGYGKLRHEALKPILRQYLLDHPVDLVHIQHLMGFSVSFMEVLQELKIPVVLTANDFWFLCEQIHLMAPEGTVCSGPETIDKCVQCLSRRVGTVAEEQLPKLFHYMAERRYAHQQALQIADLILCPSKFLFDTFRRYGFDNGHMIHASQGVRLFEPIERPPHAIPPLVVSYLGNIAYRKGLDLLIEAFNQIDADRAELHIYGAVVESEYFDRVMHAVAPGKVVRYQGAYSPPDLPRILATTDVAVVPSRGENYPFVIREILHGGVPVIAAAVAGIPEIVEDGRNGFLFHENDAHDLAAKLNRLLRNPELIETLRAGIQPMKSIEQDAAEMEEYYQNVLAKHRGSRPISALLTPEVSIIIPVWNKVELTKQCLSHLAQVTRHVQYEVIVVDNASTDGTREFLATLSGDVQVITNDENLGFAKACNQGAQAARGRYLVFLNNDTIPLEGWLQAMVEEVKTHPEVAVVGSKLLYPNDTIQHAGVVFTRVNGLPYHVYRGFPANSPVVNRRREFQVVTGACMLVRREVFESVGGFDEGYRNGFEDVDLCLKIRDQGGRIIYQPRSVLYHLESQTPGRKAYDQENARRLLDRWAHRWLVDEDAVCVPDGYMVRVAKEQGQIKHWFMELEGEHNKKQWGLVAEVQRLLLSGQSDAVRPLLAHIEAWPDDPGILSWAGQVCDRLGELACAEPFWRRALNFGESPDAHLGLARLAIERGALDEAEGHLNAHLTHADGEGMLLQGVLAMQRQEYAAAMAAFEKALRHGVNPRRGSIGLGMAAMAQGQIEKAWESFAAVLANDIDDAEALHCLLRAGTALERWQPLTEYLLSYLKINPADLSVRFALAGVQVRQGDWEAAREQYEMIKLLEPTFSGLDDLAQILDKQTPGVSA